MTPDQRLAVILTGLGALISLVGWMARQLMLSIKDDIAENGAKLDTIVDNLADHTVRIVKLEEWRKYHQRSGHGGSQVLGKQSDDGTGHIGT
jgi:hypothetical protein